MELFQASNQWSTRPEDERFSTLSDMYAQSVDYARSAAESQVPFADIRVEKVDDDLQLVGRTGTPAKLTHYAFGQIASLASAPARYLRTLPATLAAQNLNYGLRERSDDSANDAKLLFHRNGSLILRAVTTELYERIWNHEVIKRLLDVEAVGWRVPPARPALENQKGTRKATEADVLQASDFGLSISVGDDIAPAGLYLSDHDMFVFMVNEQARINNGTPDGLSRGVFFTNSEVGDGAITRTTFLYEHVCGNHIVWGASNVKKLSFRHVGKVREKLPEFQAELREYADSSVSEDEAIIRNAQTRVIAATKDEVLDALFKLRITDLTRKSIGAAYDLAVEYETEANAAPNTVYGMVHGLTRLSQQTPYADERSALDVAAGKVMQIVF